MRCIIDHRGKCSYFRIAITNKRSRVRFAFCLRVKDSQTHTHTLSLSLSLATIAYCNYAHTNKLGKTRSYGYLPYHPFPPAPHPTSHFVWVGEISQFGLPTETGGELGRTKTGDTGTHRVKSTPRPGSTSLPAEGSAHG